MRVLIIDADTGFIKDLGGESMLEPLLVQLGLALNRLERVGASHVHHRRTR